MIRTRDSRYGQRTVSVGEARYPGPPRRPTFQLRGGCEPLVRSNIGRSVVPRVHHEEVPVRDTWLDEKPADVANSEPCATVVASSGALHAAGVLGAAVPTPIAGGVSAKKFFHLGTAPNCKKTPPLPDWCCCRTAHP